MGRAAALVLAAGVGALPGLLAYLRLRRDCVSLPSFLRELRPSRSVAQRLERTQWKAWAPFRRNAAALPPSDQLLEACRAAYREAFAGREMQLMQSNLDGIAAASRAATVSSADTTGSAAAFADLAFHVDRLYPFAAVAIAVRPAGVALDAVGRPHSEDGPALAWADGTRIFAWHGRLVPPDALDPSLTVTRSRIDHETDPDRRWVLIERYGLGRYLQEAGAREIQRDDCGQLYRLAAQRLGEPILAVRVVNHTPELDGTFREFWLRVPPTMTTACEAVAWTFGLPANEYAPVAQS